jgi:hypothetical protein
MACGAGVGGIVDRMALGTGRLSMVGTISITGIWMQNGRVPITGAVALCTVCAVMAGRFGVTGDACSREPAVNTAGMTLRTAQAGMRTGQRESRAGMVKTGRFPAAGGMAGTAARPELTAMSILPGMAGIAVGRCALEDAVDMTTRAGRIDVLTCQFESGQIVVEVGWFPPRGGMAGTAVRPELAAMSILPRMAGIAVGGSALEDAVDMTTRAGCVDMLTCQFENGYIMVEVGWFPP